MEVGKFELCLKNAISLVEFKVKSLKQDLDLNQANDKIKFLNEACKVLLKTKNNFEKEVYIEKISENYGISKEAIYAELNKLEYANSKGEKVLERQGTVRNIGTRMTKKEDTSSSTSRENLIIFLLINEGQEVFDKIKNEISPEDFKNEQNKKIAKILYEELKKGNISNVMGLFEQDEEMLSHITYILSKESDIKETDKVIDDLKKKFVKEKLQEEKADILRKLVSSNLSKEDAQELETRLKEISKEMINIK